MNNDLAMFRVVFEGRMFSLQGDWVPCRINELTSEVGLTMTILCFQSDSYRGKIVEVERLYKRN